MMLNKLETVTYINRIYLLPHNVRPKINIFFNPLSENRKYVFSKAQIGKTISYTMLIAHRIGHPFIESYASTPHKTRAIACKKGRVLKEIEDLT